MNTIERFISFRSTRYVCAQYTPQPDITAYELAKLLPFFHHKELTEEAWNELGEIQRHLTRTDE